LDKEDNGLEVRLNSKGYISKRGRIMADSKLVCRSCNKIIKFAENKATDEANFKFALFHKS
jgi:hypothetical protein